MELEPIEPRAAVELYLADRELEDASSTLRSHRSRLQFFVEWCEDESSTDLNELTGRSLKEYRLWRRNDGDLAPASENCQMDMLRVFFRWLESIDGVPKDFHQKVRSPAIDRSDESRDAMLEPEDAEDVLPYLLARKSVAQHSCRLPEHRQRDTHILLGRLRQYRSPTVVQDRPPSMLVALL